jgi:hypothetical protein
MNTFTSNLISKTPRFGVYLCRCSQFRAGRRLVTGCSRKGIIRPVCSAAVIDWDETIVGRSCASSGLNPFANEADRALFAPYPHYGRALSMPADTIEQRNGTSARQSSRYAWRLERVHIARMRRNSAPDLLFLTTCTANDVCTPASAGRCVRAISGGSWNDGRPIRLSSRFRCDATLTWTLPLHEPALRSECYRLPSVQDARSRGG